MKIKGEDIKRLIPQREPFMMIDEIEASDGTHAVAALTVLKENYFILPDKTMAETGLIEHIAQSCSALMGLQALEQEGSGDKPPVGLIGEVKHFECMRRPEIGEKVSTTIEFGFSFGNATLATGESRVGDETIAKAQVKIFSEE